MEGFAGEELFMDPGRLLSLCELPWLFSMLPAGRFA